MAAPKKSVKVTETIPQDSPAQEVTPEAGLTVSNPGTDAKCPHRSPNRIELPGGTVRTDY